MTTNIRATDQAIEALDEAAANRPPDNVNELNSTFLYFCNILGKNQSPRLHDDEHSSH